MAISKVKASGWHKLTNAYTYATGWQDRGTSEAGSATEIWESEDFYFIFIRAEWAGTGNSGSAIMENLNLPRAGFNTMGAMRKDNDAYPILFSISTNTVRYYGNGFASGSAIYGNIVVPKV